MLRRRFLQKLIHTLAGIGVTGFWPKDLFANWPAEHFAGNSFSEQFRQVFADKTITKSDAIKLQIPETAENGAVVPLTIESSLTNISRIYLWVEKNPTPLAMELDLDAAMAVFITARIKMAESCRVIVIAQQGEHLLKTEQWVNVMQGGCGTG